MIDIPTILPQKELSVGKVPGIREGDSVTWHSPLFGRITGGPVLRVDENRYELIHPLTGEKVSLPRSADRSSRKTTGNEFTGGVFSESEDASMRGTF